MNKKQIKKGLRLACFSVLCALFLSLSAYAAIPKAEEVRTNGSGIGMMDGGRNNASDNAKNATRGAKDAAGDIAHGAGNAMGKAARGAGDAIGDAARDAGDAVGDAASDAGDAVSDALDGALDRDNGVISDGHAEDGHVDDGTTDHQKDDGNTTGSKDAVDSKDNTMMDQTEKKDGRFNWIWIIVLILAAAVVLWLLLMPRKRNGV